MSAATGRRLVALTIGLATLVALLPASPSAASQVASVVVTAANSMEEAAKAVVEKGGLAKERIGLVRSVVAEVPKQSVESLAQDRRIAFVTDDYSLRSQGSAFGGSPASAYPSSVGAPELWGRGITGRGVAVALVDTGVSDHPDLGRRVVASADLTPEGTFTDSYGHGTFLAGLIAGDGAASEGRFIGIAPEANLVSIKVAGADGATTLGRVLYALQLVGSSVERYNIRVLALALAGPVREGPDPLRLALERLWANGLIVIVAAGNDGPNSGSVTSPGIDPYLVTVGASNDAGTVDRSDDSVPDWSSRGPAPDGSHKPDFVAPGTSVVSLRAPGSLVDSDYAQARVEDNYFRGSGTSMAVGVAAGGAALLVQAHPELTPDQVKGRLMGSAAQLSGEIDIDAAGTGLLDVAAAEAVEAPPSNDNLAKVQAETLGSPDAPGARDESFDWSSGPAGQERWLGRYWAARYWAGRYWAGRYWAGRYWADAEWSARYWAGRYWAGRYWASDEWTARYWAGRYWAAFSWK